jgi:ribulose-5-phosphate 4-epimerase/fuculose-1-phosphate aldolase
VPESIARLNDRIGDNALGDLKWRLRCDLAACYQLIDLYGLSDMASTHISARLPGVEDHFLLNPFGMFFDEISASTLITVDMLGNIVAPANAPAMNPAGFVIHSAIHMSQPHLICALHTHTRANNAIAMQKDGLMPLTQKALGILPFVRYNDFEGAELDLNERDRLLRDLGDGRILILRNHGALTVGEMACRYQVDGLAGGRELHWLSHQTIDHTMQQGREGLGKGGFLQAGKLQWPSLLRKLERERGASYRS